MVQPKVASGLEDPQCLHMWSRNEDGRKEQVAHGLCPGENSRIESTLFEIPPSAINSKTSMRLQSARGRYSGTKTWLFSANAGAALEEKKKENGGAGISDTGGRHG